jgi:hypothetical protein
MGHPVADKIPQAAQVSADAETVWDSNAIIKEVHPERR